MTYVDYKALVAELCDINKSYKEIGQKFNLDEKQLSTYVMVMRRAGVKIPRRQRRYTARFNVDELNEIIEQRTAGTPGVQARTKGVITE